VVSTLAIVALAGEGAADDAAKEAFRVIVHPGVQGTQIPRHILSSIFLKEQSRWGDGRLILPVDQSLKSAVRKAFSDAILKTPVDGISSIWHGKMRSGIAPPPVKSSDEDVIAYVARTQGAIGYVSSDARLPATVKPLVVIE
jgi:ABC-type phosphate transport system substrate-binding protein